MIAIQRFTAYTYYLTLIRSCYSPELEEKHLLYINSSLFVTLAATLSCLDLRPPTEKWSGYGNKYIYSKIIVTKQISIVKMLRSLFLGWRIVTDYLIF